MPIMTRQEIKVMAQPYYKGNDQDLFYEAVFNLQLKTQINANWFLAIWYAESGKNEINPSAWGGYKNGYKGIFQVGIGALETMKAASGGSVVESWDNWHKVKGSRQAETYYWFLKGHGLLKNKMTNPADAYLGNVYPRMINENWALDRPMPTSAANAQADWLFPGNSPGTRRIGRAGFINTWAVNNGDPFKLLGEVSDEYISNTTTQQQAQQQGIAQAEENEQLVKYIDLNPFLKEIDSNLKEQERGYINTTWGKSDNKYNYVGFRQYLFFLAHSFMPHGIIPFVELIPNYQMTKSKLNQAQKDLKQNTDKVIEEVLQKYVGSYTDESVLEAKRRFNQLKEEIPGYNETRYNNQVAKFNQLSQKVDLFTLDPWQQEFNDLYKLNESGEKSFSKKNVGLRVYGQLVLMPNAEDYELTKSGEIGFENVSINMGNTATKGLSLIEFKLKDVQGNKFTDINSPWSFLFDARPGTASADFLFRFGWSIKVPPLDKNNVLSNMFWNHEGWKLFPESYKNMLQQESIKNSYYILITQSLDFKDYLWDNKNNKNETEVGITEEQSSAYMQLSLLRPQIETDETGTTTATIQFRTGAGMTKNCPLNLAYTCQNIVALYPGGVTLTGLVIAVKTDLDNNSIKIDDPGILEKKGQENINKSKQLTNGSRDLTGILKVIGAIDYGENNDDQTINPDSIIINFNDTAINRIRSLENTDTLWSWFSDLLSFNECTLLNFMNGSGLLLNEEFVITTTQAGAQPINKTKQRLNPDNLKDVLISEKDIFAYKHQSSLIQNISFLSNERPNQFTIALNYRLGEWLNYNNNAFSSDGFNNDQANSVNVLDRKTNIINMFSQTMEVDIVCLCQPWISPGIKFYLKGTGFQDGNYSCLEVNHSLGADNIFLSTIKAIRIIPPGDQELEKSLSSPEIYDNKIGNSASIYDNTNSNNLDSSTKIPFAQGNKIPQYIKIDKTFIAKEKFLKPTKGKISSKFGPRIHPIEKVQKFHNGIDIAAPIGTPVIACKSGVVSHTSSSKGGIELRILHQDGTQSIFLHLSQRLVANGSYVEQGQLVALVGNTGGSKGPHLHFSIKNKNGAFINPEPSMVS